LLLVSEGGLIFIENIRPSIKTMLTSRRDTISFAGLALFLLASFWIMATRHFYDDEVASIRWVAQRGFLELFAFINSTDVHPPLSYLVNRLFWFEHYPRLLFVPAVALNAMAVFFFFRSASARLNDRCALICLFCLTFLNSEVLMWGISVRWYSIFVPLSIFLFTVLLLREVNVRSIYLVALTLVVLTYTCYLIFLLLPFVCALLWLRGGRRHRKHLLAAALIYCFLTAYQYWIFATVHRHGSDSQQFSLLNSFAYAVLEVVNGSSAFPLEPLAVLKNLAILFLFVAAILRWRRESVNATSIVTISALVVGCIAMLTITGLGGKMRNGAFLNIWFALLMAMLIPRAPGWIRVGVTGTVLGFTVLSSYNLMAGTETLKDRYNFPIKETVSLVEDCKRRNQGVETIVYVTNDPTIAFELTNRRIPVYCPHTGAAYVKPIPARKGDRVIFIDHEKGALSDSEYAAIQKRRADIMARSRVVEGPLHLGSNKWYRLKGKISRRPFHSYYLEMTVVELQEDIVLRPYLDEFKNTGAANKEILRNAE
jgi:hypothetical protein